ncbi:hypothetical protein [Legionella londiniensis]|uniref:Uncharacterized protein n=1 Tax=Legionella londiniensis TaxID=45068 RepID=A0A0W0VNC2_9GAMM|nr:hypothetical protein [Legionella londiniensis]KTD21555.1 hypothetical protein Llon_0720 [Legionella londiniensis]STX92768.1 Uncharacterised protein [Legionella londiniensis]
MGLYNEYEEYQSSDLNYENNEDIEHFDESEHKKRIRRLLEEKLERKRLREELEDELDGEFDWDELDK